MPTPALDPVHPSARRRPPRRTKVAAFGALALLGAVLLPAAVSGAATSPGLGTAESFAVLGASTVTNTGPTVVNGDLGVHPGEAVTGFDGGPGIVNGTIHAGDATAADAQSAADIAYDAVAAQACDATLTDQDLGGRTLTPGVYCFSSSAQLTGPLTLDAVGDPDAVFIFRMGTTLTTASSSSVGFTDDFASCNVFWQVGSAATLGTDTDFVGTVIAKTEAITANTGATIEGRLLSLNAAVTLDSNTITAPSCAPADSTPVDDTPAGDTAEDETPVETAPDDATPVDDTPVDDTSDDGTAPVDDGSDLPASGTPASPGLVTEGSAGGSPSGPGLAVTGGPGGPGGPHPTLPATGSDLVIAGFGALTLLAGAAMVLTGRRLA